MPDLETEERELLDQFDRGLLKSVASKQELARLRAAARATGVKDKRVNIRLSSLDLQEIQARALEQGLPYQTLIASVLHQYATGRLRPRTASDPSAPRAAPRARRSPSA